MIFEFLFIQFTHLNVRSNIFLDSISPKKNLGFIFESDHLRVSLLFIYLFIDNIILIRHDFFFRIIFRVSLKESAKTSIIMYFQNFITDVIFQNILFYTFLKMQ